MIGGFDARIRSRAGKQSLEAAVRAVRQFWPEAVFENAGTGDKYTRFAQIPFGQLKELFVYRDVASMASWDENGAVPDNCNTMIHLIHDPGVVTAVADEQTDEMTAVLDGVRSALHDIIFFVPAVLPRKAA